MSEKILIREIYLNIGNKQRYITIPKHHHDKFKPGDFVEIKKVEK